jgi:glycosyltransferase involved in cell wall biosynthesis
MNAIHQFVAGFNPGDAISNEALMFRDIFRSWGYKSEIFCEECYIQKESRQHIFNVQRYASTANDNDTVLLHLSMGSLANEEFKKLSCKKAILYHNITPDHYFNLINKQTARHLNKGRQQLTTLVNTADVNMADSHFNASELTGLGYTNVKVLPLVLDFSRLTDNIDNHMATKLQDGKKNILFVGRCTPNKKIEDLLQVFAYYQKTIEPNSRLIHIGSHGGSERYYTLLTVLAKELKLKNIMFLSFNSFAIPVRSA